MRKVSALLFTSFLVIQLLALFLGYQFLSNPPVSPFSNSNNISNSYFLFAYVLITAVLLLLVLKVYKGNFLFLALEIGLIFFSAIQIFSLFLSSLYSLILSFFAIGLRFSFPSSRPYLLSFAAALVGALLGSWLGLIPAILLAALLLVYDIVAVFFTKHMIELAKSLSSRGAAFSITVSANSTKNKESFKNPNVSKSKVSKQTKSANKKKDSQTTSSNSLETIELGTGDLVIPAMIIVSALNTSLSLAIVALAGSLTGMLALIYLLERKKGYYPALPPLAGGAIVFILIYLVIH